MGFPNFFKNPDPFLENHVNSADVIKCRIKLSSVLHEICYYEVQINEESCIQYIYLQFIYLLLLFSSVCVHSAEGNKYQAGSLSCINLSNEFLKISNNITLIL